MNRRVVRELAPLALVAALAGASIAGLGRGPSRPGTLAILVDDSASVPAELRAAALLRIERDLRELPRGTQVAVLPFAREAQLAGIESAARASERLRSIASRPPAGSTTDVGAAISKAAGVVGLSGGGSVLLATDGVDLAGDALEAAQAAARAGIRLDLLPIESGTRAEVSVERLFVPDQIRAGQVFEATVVVRSTVDQRVEVALERGGGRVASRVVDLEAGAAHVVSFVLDPVTSTGDLIAVVSAERDEDPGNNLARADVSVAGAGRFAAVGYEGPLGFAAERWAGTPPERALKGYDAIFLDLNGAVPPSDREQEALSRFVSAGGSLLVACADPGRAAALRGGPLEEVLPVRLEPPSRLRDETAVVVLLDRSGSMSGGTGTRGGETSPLSLARDAALALGSLLSPKDRLGIIAFDVAPHVLLPLSPAGELAASPGAAAGVLPALGASGGTDWTSSLELALRWLAADPGPRRHVVLVSDGDLGPGVTGELAHAWPAGVTLSTVSVGERGNPALLETLAARHGGRHDRASRPGDLPAALRREGAGLALPAVRVGPFRANPEPGLAALFPATAFPNGGRVIGITARAGAQVVLASDRGDPLLLLGDAGWGRAAFLAAGLGPNASRSERQGWGRIVSTALRRGASAGKAEASALFVSQRGGWVDLDLLRPGAGGDPPVATIRFPSGKQERSARGGASSGRAHGRFLASEPGAIQIEAAGSRRRFVLAAAPERAMLQSDPDWASRLAQAGGGRVLSPGSPDGESLPVPRSGGSSADLAPVLLALAAGIFFMDSSLRFFKRPVS